VESDDVPSEQGFFDSGRITVVQDLEAVGGQRRVQDALARG
jgi:hypothetical protein